MSDIDLDLLPDYLVEASEHLEEMESLLLRLAEEPDSTELMNEIFRPIHSIKGAAQFIGLERSSHVAHRLEDLLDLLRKGKHPSSPEVVELLISARDLIVQLAEELESTQTETLPVDDMVEKISAEIDGAAAEAAGMEEEKTETTGLAGEDVAADEGPLQAEDSAQIDGENTAYEEENDPELFGIFLENLREKIDLLHTQAGELANSADKVALLERCAESLQGLQTAASYMGYEELISIYGNWLEDIVAVQEALGNNEEVPYDFMDGYLSEIKSLFPQLAQHTTAVDTECEFVDVGNENQQQEAQQQAVTDQHSENTIEVNSDEESSAEESSDVDLSLLPDYLVEAAEHLEEMESLLLSLAEEPENTAVLDEIFRPIHSIKGAAQFIGLDRSSRLAHRLEDLLDLLRKGERQSTPEVVELLISARDLIVKLADELDATQVETLSVEDMIEQITAVIEARAIEAGAAETGQTAETGLTSENGPVETETPVNAAYVEENDQELFGIFLENLREKVDLVHTQASELESSADKVALLERCAESLQGLHAAANYMSYEELTSIYSNWLEDIVAVQESLGNNEEVPYDFMEGYLSEIHALFPQLGQYQATVVSQVQADSETAPEELETAPSDSGQVDSKAAEEENLFEKLNKKLDAASSKTEDAEYELLHGVFEEMISEKENVSAATQPDSTQANMAPAKKSSKKATGKQGQQAKAKKDNATVARKSDKSVVKKSIRVDSEKIDTLINQVGELVVDRAYFFQLFDDMRGLQQHFKDEVGLDQKEMKQMRAFTYRMGEAIASLSRTSNDLQEGVMKVRMLPISQLFNRYPRLVHDLTRNNDKKVNLKVEGEDTELDKMVVENLSDPLIHIIRNAIDHGLESAEERARAGKSEAGTLFLKSYHESNQVVIEIFDDGRGIDPELVKAKAIEKGVVSKSEADRMTTQEVIRLITTAGFSTASEITDTSGRGVGMDVVRKNIEKLNGTLEIDSRLGKGTSIKLKIPLTLAIIPAHLVRVGGNMYTIPLANIEETLRIRKDETTIIEGTEVVYLRGKTLPVIHLSRLFSLDSQTKNSANLFVVVVNTGTQKIGLVVDELLGQEEVVIKPLVEYLRDESGFSGATIIGDGSISLILDIYEIASMTTNQQIRRQNELVLARQSDNSGGHLGQLAG